MGSQKYNAAAAGALIAPVVVNALFWGFLYFCNPVYHSVEAREQIRTGFLLGIGLAYAGVFPAIIAMFVCRSRAWATTIALSGPLLVNVLVWGYFYLRVPANDSLGSRGWLEGGFVLATGLSYAAAVPAISVIRGNTALKED